MDTALKDGDFLCDARGFPAEVGGVDEILQQIMIRLTVKKGSFVYDRTLGSELHTLDASDENIENRAIVLVKEALHGVSGATVKSVSAEIVDASVIKLYISVLINDELHNVTVTV